MPTGQTWQLQEAKSRFREVIEQTAFAPQSITLRGEPVAVVISVTKYKQLTKPKKKLTDILRSAPLDITDLELPERKSKKLRKAGL